MRSAQQWHSTKRRYIRSPPHPDMLLLLKTITSVLIVVVVTCVCFAFALFPSWAAFSSFWSPKQLVNGLSGVPDERQPHSTCACRISQNVQLMTSVSPQKAETGGQQLCPTKVRSVSPPRLCTFQNPESLTVGRGKLFFSSFPSGTSIQTLLSFFYLTEMV